MAIKEPGSKVRCDICGAEFNLYTKEQLDYKTGDAFIITNPVAGGKCPSCKTVYGIRYDWKGEYHSCDECGALIIDKPSVITKEGKRLCGECSCKRFEGV